MTNFIETEHCTSRVHCRECRCDESFVESMQVLFEFDGECPHGFYKEQFERFRRINCQFWIDDERENGGACLKLLHDGCPTWANCFECEFHEKQIQ